MIGRAVTLAITAIKSIFGRRHAIPPPPVTVITLAPATSSPSLQDEPAGNDADRKRADWRRWQQASRARRREQKRMQPTTPDLSGCQADRSGCQADTPQEKKEEKLERGTRIPDNWQPNDDGVRIGAEVFGAWLPNKIKSHVRYWRGREGPTAFKADWDGAWLNECDRCRHQEQLQLPLERRRQRFKAIDGNECGDEERTNVISARSQRRGSSTGRFGLLRVAHEAACRAGTDPDHES